MKKIISSHETGGISKGKFKFGSVKKDEKSNRGFIDIADVVISLNGRDEGKRFLVVGSEDEYSLIADGKGRRVEKPKRKKNKHLKLEDRVNGQVAAKLISGERVTNNEIRRTLAGYATDCGDKGGMQ